MSFIELAYNCIINSSIGYTSFEIIYGFKLLTMLDLIPLLLHELTNLNRNKNTKLVKFLYEKARANMVNKNKMYADRGNQERKKVVFAPGVSI